MSEQKRATVYLRGRIFWAKIFGSPRPNYDGDAREWTFEFEPNKNSVEILAEHGLDDRLRDRADKKGYEGRDPFIILKRNEFKVDGSPNEHIRVVDATNESWDEKANGLIGNGSEVDVKVTIVDYGPRKKDGIYPVAIRVLDLVPYQRQEFEPLDEDDKYYKAAKSKRDTFAEDFGLADGDEEVATPVAKEPVKSKKNRKAELNDGELDDDVPM